MHGFIARLLLLSGLLTSAGCCCTPLRCMPSACYSSCVSPCSTPCSPVCSSGSSFGEELEDTCYRLGAWIDAECYDSGKYLACKTRRMRQLFAWGCNTDETGSDGYSMNGYGAGGESECESCQNGDYSQTLWDPQPSQAGWPPASMPPANMQQSGTPPEPGMVPLSDGTWVSPWYDKPTQPTQLTPAAPAGLEPAQMPPDPIPEEGDSVSRKNSGPTLQTTSHSTPASRPRLLLKSGRY